MKYFIQTSIFLYFLSIFPIASHAIDNGDNYEKTKKCFENFATCELNRSDALDHFDGKPFKIIMINFFDAVQEGDLLIVTGAVKCWVDGKYENLFIAVGVRELMGYEKVYYYLVRKKDFITLATELMNYPYKERCRWDRYWIDIK